MEPPIFPTALLKYREPIQVEEVDPGLQGVLEIARKQADNMDTKPVLAKQEEVLPLMLPPREKDGWVQAVSDEVPTRLDVRELTDIFDMKLEDSKARLSGICATRNTIFRMCFDELLRQVTVDCSEQGLFLLRLRNEQRMTSDAYQTLYEASVGLGRRKAVEAERGKRAMIDRIDDLYTTKTDLQKEASRLSAKLKAMQRCCQEQQQADHKKFTEEISFLEHTNRRLVEQEATIKRLQEEEKKKLS